MKKIISYLTLIAFLVLASCSGEKTKKEVLTDPQIDAQIGAVIDHVGYVGDYDVSPDGNTIVTVSTYDYVLWDANTGKELKAVRPDKYKRELFRFGKARFSPDGKYIAIGGYYGLKIIDAEQMQELKTFLFDDFSGKAFDFSKDGKYLLLADGKVLKAIDLGTMEIAKTFGQSDKNYTDIVFLDNTDFITLEYGSEDMYMWNIDEEKDIMSFTVTVNSGKLSASNDGKYIALYNDDTRAITIYNTETSEEKSLATGYVNDFTFSGDKLITIDNYNIKFYDINQGNEIKKLDISGNKIKFNQDKNLLYYIDNGVNIIDPSTGNKKLQFGNDAQGVYFSFPAPTNNFLVLQVNHKYYSGSLNLLSLPMDTTAKTLLLETGSKDFGTASYVGHSDNLAVLVSNGDIKVYDLNNGSVVKQASDLANEPLTVSPDAKLLVAKDYNQSSTYALFDFEKMQKTKDLTNSSAYVQYAGFTPDGKYYVLSDNNGAFVYDIEAGQELESGSKLKNTKWVDKIEDQYIAIIGDITEMSIANLTNGEKITTFEDVAAKSIAMSPDKRYIAIAPRDHFGIYLYDLKEDQWEPVLYGHSYFPTSVAFTADSKYLISTSDDNQTIIWDVATGKKVLTIVVYDLGNGKEHTADYLVFAPNGRYDGTPAAIERFLYFEKDGQRLPASQYKDQCYTPNLLGRILK